MDKREISSRDIEELLKDTKENVSHDTVNRWRSGEVSPRLDEVYELAKALRIPFLGLIGESEAKINTEDEERILRLARFHGYDVADNILFDAIPLPQRDPRIHGERKDS